MGLGDIKAQSTPGLKNMESTLQAGGREPADIIKITFFLTDIRDKNAVWDVRKEMFGKQAGLHSGRGRPPGRSARAPGSRGASPIWGRK